MLDKAVSARREKQFFCLLVLIFIAFTWRGLFFFYSGDDMMNMWKAWTLNPWRLARALVLPWEPVYRPLGGAIYRTIYKIFGFHPLPLYAFCYALLLVNLTLTWRTFRLLGLSAAAALTGVAVGLFHGKFLDLYISAGTIYDRLVYLFTVLALAAYAKARRDGLNWKNSLLIWLLCLAAVDSKESAVMTPVLLLLYELVLVRGNWKKLVPLASAMALLGVAFVFGRVRRTPDLMQIPDYNARITPEIWLGNVSRYLSMLTYDHLPLSAWTAALLLIAMLGIALAARRRLMIFGWFFFVLAILPVATIAPRLGYVLYLPALGLALWLADAMDWLAPRAATFALVAVASLAFHLANYPAFGDPNDNPEARFTQQMRSEYPRMNPYAKFLFVSDYFPRDSFDLKFNLELLYHLPMRVYRLEALPDQRPDPNDDTRYDHVFTKEDGHYVELDNRNVEEAIRLRVLRHYSAGRHLNMLNKDHSAYIVSGFLDGESDSPGRWTLDKARLKFDLYPADMKLTISYYVAKNTLAPGKAFTVAINGNPAGSAPMQKPGTQEVTLQVPAAWISRAGYTLMDIAVSQPVSDGGDGLLGVVLNSADFEYTGGK